MFVATINEVYVVGKEDFCHGFIYKPVKVFLNEWDAKEWCEKHNKGVKYDDLYIYRRFPLEW